MEKKLAVSFSIVVDNVPQLFSCFLRALLENQRNLIDKATWHVDNGIKRSFFIIIRIYSLSFIVDSSSLSRQGINLY